MIIKELVLKAVKEDNLEQVLIGKEDYKCEISEFIATEVPTDWPNIIRSVYVLYKEMPDLIIDNKFEHAINCMCDKTYYELYCAVMVIFFQIMSEERHIAPFHVNRESIIKKMRHKLHSFKEELQLCKEWTGKKYQNGLWGDICRVNTILMEDYGITII